MKIKEIELNNFRIYNGKNSIDLSTSDNKNIIIISGENGFGKTTFLMAIVWCLYGKQMEYVDEMYKTEINSKRGGYSGYMSSCLNKVAESNGESKFSVSLTLSGLDLPEDIKCEEVRIIRSYDTKNASGDDLLILFDGNQYFPLLPKDDKIESEEHFIRERIMPIEIAKFFFFDAERIVAYAKLDTNEQLQNLADAYSQVLGIQKYEELKRNLQSLKDDYRRKGVSSIERDEFEELDDLIKKYDESNALLLSENKRKKEEIRRLEDESNSLLSRLVLDGNTMTQEQLDEYHKKQIDYKDEMQSAQNGLKEFYNFIPFGLAGELFAQLVDQVNRETEYRHKKVQNEVVDENINSLLNELDEESQSAGFPIDRRIRRFYEDKIKDLMTKHFSNANLELEYQDLEELHGFTDLQKASLMNIVSNVKTIRKSFTALYDKYNSAKRQYNYIEQIIREAEARAESTTIKVLKAEKENVDAKVAEIRQQVISNELTIQNQSEDIVTAKKKKETLSNKIELSKQFEEKDMLLTDILNTINAFLISFKEDKKQSLQKKILENLQKLLHKQSLVSNVIVMIRPNIVDISLIGETGQKIEISDLSNGEKQMFSTALLSALVEETGLKFPVFIDSPMQKFDTSHSRNILEKFYPSVSDQVVLFPLLKKELIESEYLLIKDNVEKTILIQNNENGSKFVEISKDDLFKN